MRSLSIFTFTGLLAVLACGCAGPSKKLGRGVLNATEFARLGELRRSVEQTAIWENTDSTYTTGVIRGLNRSLVRTAVGVFEIATFPFPTPNYEPIFTSRTRVFPDPSIRTTSYPYGGLVMSEYPVYPDNYRPNLISDTTFHTDTALGFSGGDVAPFIPGSRFRIFDN